MRSDERNQIGGGSAHKRCRNEFMDKKFLPKNAKIF